MSRDQTTADVTERLLQTDIGLLNDHNVSDDTMSILAAEHAARTETLAKAIDPTLGRPLLVMIAGALLSAAKQIDAATVMQPELVQ
ncbi:hypothetical protein [Sphingomonas melonis]|uniref:hypothetical protein n=1 Tax=Sphingomonas melonis TaxID=152682 RepID=UPI001F90DD3D|nr:hypothetical protein [Candidatus Sphingomonas excrementigallinarum]